MTPCQSDARRANVDNVLDRFLAELQDAVKEFVPDIKWKKSCLQILVQNPRPEVVLEQIENFVEESGSMPLASFNSKKCKAKELSGKALALDKCMFGDLLDDLTAELESDPTRSIEETKLCENVDSMVKCVKSAIGKCFGKKVLKEVDQLYMGIIAYGVTQRLAALQYDSGHLAQCSSFKSLKPEVKKNWIRTKTGSDTCDLAAYYKELGLGLVCDMKAGRDANVLILKLHYGVITVKEMIEEACLIRKHVIEVCSENINCLNKKMKNWLTTLQKRPIHLLLSQIMQRVGEFQWKECPN